MIFGGMHMKKFVKLDKIPCIHCLGKGRVYKIVLWLPCPVCKGKGTITKYLRGTVSTTPKIYDENSFLRSE